MFVLIQNHKMTRAYRLKWKKINKTKPIDSPKLETSKFDFVPIER